MKTFKVTKENKKTVEHFFDTWAELDTWLEKQRYAKGHIEVFENGQLVSQGTGNLTWSWALERSLAQYAKARAEKGAQ